VQTLKDGEYVSVPAEKLGKILMIEITQRDPGGAAIELVITADSGTVKILGEYNIRYVLNDNSICAIRQDGSKAPLMSLLPSSFFILETEVKKGFVRNYRILGGGFGHGVGMSQNGAKKMAEEGYTAEQILLFFYEGCMLERIYG